MNDEKQRKREIEILEYLRKQEELTQEEAEAVQGGKVSMQDFHFVMKSSSSTPTL